jgi:hypothetical protein
MQVAGLLLALLCVTTNYAVADESAQERNAKSPGRILRAHTLEMEVEYMRLYENMSMKPPKGDKKNPKNAFLNHPIHRTIKVDLKIKARAKERVVLYWELSERREGVMEREKERGRE